MFSSKEGYVDTATTVTVAASYLVTWKKKTMQLLGQIILGYFVHSETGKVKKRQKKNKEVYISRY